MTVVISTPVTATTPAVIADLLRAYPRLLRWQPALGAAVAAVALLVWKYDEVESVAAAVWMMRISGLIMAVGAVFLLDDASANITDSGPTRRRLRSGLRLMLMSAVVMIGCMPLVVVIVARVSLGSDWWGVLLEIAVLTTVGAAFSLTMQRWRGLAEPGQFAGVAVIGTMVAANMLSARWPMLVTPGPDWDEAHQRWGVPLLMAGVLVVWQLRDSAARSWTSALHMK